MKDRVLFTVLLWMWAILCTGKLINAEVPPKWPTQVETSVRLTLVERNAEIYANIYFDEKKNALTLSVTSEAGKQTSIYLLDSNEVLYITEENECNVKPIPDSLSNILFTNSEGRKQIKNFGSIMMFDEHTKAELSNLTEIFGIQVEKWESKGINLGLMPIKCDIDHYITMSQWQSPGCKYETPCRQIIYMEAKCNGEDETQTVQFKANFFDTRYFLTDEEVFQQPSGYYCQNKASTIKFPILPKYYAFDFESFDASEELESNNLVFSSDKKIWFDKENNVMRRDQIDENFQVTFTLIGDYNKKIVYTVEASKGMCEIANMSTTNTIERDTLLTGETFPWFPDLTENEPQYVGKRKKHNLNFEVWVNSEKQDDVNMISDYYFLNQTGSEESDTEYLLTPVLIEVKITSGSKVTGSVLQLISKFRTKSVEWTAFDITDCYPESDKIRFYLNFTDPEGKDLSQINREDVKQNLRTTLLDTLKISFLRLGIPEIAYITNDYIILSSIIVEDPEKLGYGISGNELSNNEVFKTLYKKIYKEELKIPLTKDRTIVATELTYPNYINNFDTICNVSVFVYENREKEKEKPKSGYSGGALLGVAIGMLVIGSFQGAVLLVAYIRYRRSDRLVRKLTGSQEQNPNSP